MTDKTFVDGSQNQRAKVVLIAACLAGLSLCAEPVSAQSQPSAAARGGAPGGLTQNFSANSSKPVNIEAAALVVDDKKKTATFTGAVVVVQGDVKLKADEIVVHYVSTDKSAAGAKPAATPASLTGGQGGSTEISTIDATGSVLVTTANDQNVSGDHAIFNVKAQTVVVSGEKVVVSQGKSVLQGQRLTVNVTDGTYKMDGKQRLSFTANPMEIKEQADAMKAQADAKPEAKPEPKPRKKPAEAPSHAPQPPAGAWRVDGSGQ